MRKRLIFLSAVLGLSSLLATLVLVPAPQATVAQPAGTPATLPEDLALIPGDAIGFAHVRLRDIWNHETLTDVRKIFEKAGPVALASLDKDFTPPPTTIDRITMVMLPFEQKPEPRFVTILSFNAPFNATQVQKRYMAKAEMVKVGDKEFVMDKQAGISVYFPSNKTIVFGDETTIPQFLKIAGKPGRLQSAVAGAAGKPMTVCINVKALPIPPEAANELPEELRALLNAEQILLQAELGKQITLNASLSFESEDAAKEGMKAVKKGCEFGRIALMDARKQAEELLKGRGKQASRPLEELPEAIGGLAMLGGINTLDEFLAEPPLTINGKSVTASLALPAFATPFLGTSMLTAGLALPAVQKIRNAAARTQSMNNLKQIGIAMHNYHDANGFFPPAAITDKKGKKLHSWRVAILPYIEQNNIYSQLKLDEPWDSEHNKKFTSVSIKTYMDPRIETPAGKTTYRVFVGQKAPFDWVKGRSSLSITDGTSNTIMVVSAGEPIEWAKPEDFEFDPEKALPDLSKPFGPELITAFCDGSLRVLKTDMKDFDKLMKLLIQPSDGMVIPNFE